MFDATIGTDFDFRFGPQEIWETEYLRRNFMRSLLSERRR